MWDCHCHLADPGWDDLCQRLDQARQQGIHGWLSCATNPDSWPRQQALSLLPGVLIAQGLHPWWAHLGTPECLAGLTRFLPGAVAVGECGLDFYKARDEESRQQQRQVLRHQLNLASQFQLPVVIHCVRAQEALLQELRAFAGIRFMVHGFLGNLQEAQQWLRQGAYLSLGPHALSRTDLMKQLPLDRVLAESDAPARGSTLLDVARVAEAWRQHQPLQEDHFEANLCRFLGIPQKDSGRRTP
jgi:TatD DNase family protein